MPQRRLEQPSLFALGDWGSERIDPALLPERYVLEIFAGAGGWDKGAQIIGLDLPIVGIELNADACATATAAGFIRHRADVRNLDPADFPGAVGLIISPPCPSFSQAGLRTGLGSDYQLALDSITHLGEGCNCDWADLPQRVQDPRTALVVELARWSLGLENIEWMVAEEVAGVEFLFEDFIAELYAAGWESADHATLDAAKFGSPARRSRQFIAARRYEPTLSLFDLEQHSDVTRSVADVLGWDETDFIRTRGNRRNTGGNLFNVNQPSWCMTEKARSWVRESNGDRLSAAEAGLLQCFGTDHPWTGSRTAQFHQIGDVVNPLVGAAVIATATRHKTWRDDVHRYAAELFESIDTKQAAAV